MYEDLILLLLLLRGKTGIIKFIIIIINSMILIFRPSGNARRLSGALQLLIQNTGPHMCLPLPKKQTNIVRKENVETSTTTKFFLDISGNLRGSTFTSTVD